MGNGTPPTQGPHFHHTTKRRLLMRRDGNICLFLFGQYRQDFPIT